MAKPEEMLPGWGWFDQEREAAPAPDELCRAAAACLQTSSGRVLLGHLERSFLNRRIPPNASGAELRHAEGQRSVVDHLLRLVERGRQDPQARRVP